MLLSIVLFWASSFAWSAQDAKILQDETPIYDQPDETGRIIARIARGTILRISERPRAGYFKIRLGDRSFGWVHTRDVSPNTIALDLKAAGIANTDVISRTSVASRFVLRAFYGMHFLQPTALAQLAGATAKFSSGGTGLGAELGYKFNSEWVLSAHVATFSYTKSETAGSYTADGMVMGFAGDCLLWFLPPFRLALGFGGGITNGATIGYTPASGTAVTSQAFIAPQAFVRALFSWYVLPQVAVNLEGGYRYLDKQGVVVGESTIAAALSSAYAAAGAQVEF